MRLSLSEGRFIYTAMASLGGITADNVGNLGDIEKQWAVKALEHAETYYRILCEVQPSTLRLTRIDDELYEDFRKKFPSMNVACLKPDDLNGNEAIKEQWMLFIMPYETRIAHYNFGTLIRLDTKKEYTDENSYFVTRTQFYAVEIARNKEGHNEEIYRNYQQSKQ